MKRLKFVVLFALLAAAPALATPPADSIQALARRQPDDEAIRSVMLREMAALEAGNPQLAGSAASLAAMTYERAGAADSAATLYLKAWTLRGILSDLFSYVDVLFRRQASGDLEDVRRRLEEARNASNDAGTNAQEALAARLAWARSLSGDAQGARDLFLTLSPEWSFRLLWRYRMAKTWLDAGERRRATPLAIPVAVASRGQEPDVIRVLSRASGMNDGQTLESLATELAHRDRSEAAIVARMGGRRVRFAARDGFPLGGVVIEPARKGRRPAIVWLRAPGDSLAAYDSLAIAFRGAGYAILLLDPRGTGWSIGPTCPLPEAWDGRENDMIESVASDVREALRALATSTPTDTSRYTLVATGESALPGLRAAERDRRVTSLVMLSAETPPLEWGPLRATIGRLRMPVFWSQSPEDYPLFDVYDECYQAGERRSSRVADVKGGGHGAWPFRSDTTAAPRLIRWLAEKRPPRAAPAPPPPSRRKG